MPHIQGLQVLNDCEENQKLLTKLPDWITSRWNRYVTEQLDKGKDYPSFYEFASFISKEARIACNPVSSLYALKPPADIQEVCEKLQVASEPVQLKLATMVKRDSIVKSQRVQGLKIRGFYSDINIELPPAYTRDFIPLERAHIPTCQTARKWQHLANLASEMPPLMDCAVGLLRGYDCSRALAPREVIIGGDSEPYAVRTDLGWSIVGGAPQLVNASNVTGLCHRVSVKEVPAVTPSTIIKVLESDFADTKPTDSGISQEDIQFLQILNNQIRQNEQGHLEMPLPFKARPQLPNNKSLALVRLKQLKKKLDRDPKFKADYVKFMEGVLRDGDAEKAVSQPEQGSVPGIYRIKAFITPASQRK
ncbi:hypothetical protein WMY93_027218 [Mugilogobius chulae]|uniref:Uncharacterized protein n=1 Tax=Mugilogobius chulae TaxID=88201 RepID=A0AAW0N385_9GOBI